MSHLSDVANGLAVGGWAKLTIPSLEGSLRSIPAGQSEGSILPFAGKMVRDGVKGKFRYFGGDETAPLALNASRQKQWEYVESSNTAAQITPHPAALDQAVMHSYNNNTWDPQGGIWWYYNGNNSFIKGVASSESFTSQTVNLTSLGFHLATEWFPDVNGIWAVGNHTARLWTPSNNVLSPTVGTLAVGELHCFAQYSAGQRAVLFGGGQSWPGGVYKGHREVYYVTSSLTVSRGPDAPVNCDIMASVVTVDPVSGDWIILGPSAQIFSHRMGQGFTQHASPPAAFIRDPIPAAGNSYAALVVAAPVPEYGVTAFLKHRFQSGYAELWLYRHSAGGTPPPPPPPPPTGNFSIVASPTTVKPGETITAMMTAPTGRPNDDWWGFFLDGQPNTNYLQYGSWGTYSDSMGGATEKTVQVVAPNAPGVHEFRINAQPHPYLTTLVESNPITIEPPIINPPTGQHLFPAYTRQQVRDAFTRFGFTWNAATAEPNLPSRSGFFFNPGSVHNDTEQDDLFYYILAYRMYGQQGYLTSAQVVAAYMSAGDGQGGYYDDVKPGSTEHSFLLDHIYIWGLVAYHQFINQSGGTPNNTYLTAAQNLLTLVKNKYASSVPGTHRIAEFLARAPGRALLGAVAVAAVTGASGDIAFRNKMVDLILQSPDFENHGVNGAGMWFAGQQDTDTVMGGGVYAAGGRMQHSPSIGVLSEGLYQAYRFGYRAAEIKTKLLAIAEHAHQFGVRAITFGGVVVNNYAAAFYGKNPNGSPFIDGQVNPVSPTFGDWDDPVYTFSFVNLFTYAYKLSGDPKFLSRAQQCYISAAGAKFGDPVPRTVSAGVIHHFPGADVLDGSPVPNDSGYSSDGNAYIRWNKGQDLADTYALFENGGQPTVEGSTPPPPTPGPISLVRTGATFTSMQAAHDAAITGDVIQWSGTLLGSACFCASSKNNITYRGIGTGVLDCQNSSIQDKGCFVVTGTNTTFEDIECHSMAGSSGNIAFVRMDGTHLTLRRCNIHDGQQGILDSGNANSDILVEDCIFRRLGDGSGSTHNLYIGHSRKFTMIRGRSEDANMGHCVKSRAATTILDGVILDEGRASRALDVPDGGVVQVDRCSLIQGGASPNHNIVGYGLEGRPYTNNQLLFGASNSVTNTRPGGTQAGDVFQFGFQPTVLTIGQYTYNGVQTNNKPVITIIGGDPLSHTAGTAFTDPGATATDVEDGNITSSIVVTGGPINNQTAVGSYTLRYNVMDSGGLAADEKTRVVNVVTGNRPPTARMNAIPANITLQSGTTTASVQLDGSASTDPDGDALTYEWKNGVATIATGVTATVQLAAGTHTLSLRVSDGLVANQTTPQTVTVFAPSPAPVIQSPPEGTLLTSGQQVTAVGSGTDLTWSAEIVGLPAFAFGSGSGFTFQVPVTALTGQQILVALSGAGGTVTRTLTVETGAVNDLQQRLASIEANLETIFLAR